MSQTNTTVAPEQPSPPAPPPQSPPQPAVHTVHRRRTKPILIALAVILLLIGVSYWIVQSLNTVSTDDAYVNGHVTFVAPRVPGQVTRVLVDDNNRVHKGDLLVELDKEPYQVQVNISQAAVTAAQAELVTTEAQARGAEGQMRSLRFALDHAIEDVDNQIALLHSRVATLDSARATLTKAQADYDRAVPLLKSGAVSQENFDTRKEALAVAQAEVDEALQGVYEIRVALGLPLKPPNSTDLADVPADLDQTFSTVREAQASLIEAAAQLGVYDSFNKTPRQMITDFYKRDPSGNIDIIYAKILKNSPAIALAQAKLLQAQRDLDQAKLNLSYCDVTAEIDGVITQRQVNPGNNVIAGQSLMAIRSPTDIWVDANFKETQLARLRIGQAVDLDVDMYGRHQHFRGRISGFTMGTGSTLALLPAENATGNFVKVVQRLPVRIDLVNYHPDQAPLFVGLSVTPTVLLKEPLEGPNAGHVLQPYLEQPPLPATQPSPEIQVPPPTLSPLDFPPETRP